MISAEPTLGTVDVSTERRETQGGMILTRQQQHDAVWCGVVGAGRMAGTRDAHAAGASATARRYIHTNNAGRSAVYPHTYTHMRCRSQVRGVRCVAEPWPPAVLEIPLETADSERRSTQRHVRAHTVPVL